MDVSPPQLDGHNICHNVKNVLVNAKPESERVVQADKRLVIQHVALDALNPDMNKVSGRDIRVVLSRCVPAAVVRKPPVGVEAAVCLCVSALFLLAIRRMVHSMV